MSGDRHHVTTLYSTVAYVTNWMSGDHHHVTTVAYVTNWMSGDPSRVTTVALATYIITLQNMVLMTTGTTQPENVFIHALFYDMCNNDDSHLRDITLISVIIQCPSKVGNLGVVYM